MKRRALSVAALRRLALASAGLVATSGCLNPRPEELPSNTIAIEPDELQRELAIESWWAWTLAAAGAVLVLAALHAPREASSAVVDVA